MGKLKLEDDGEHRFVVNVEIGGEKGAIITEFDVEVFQEGELFTEEQIQELQETSDGWLEDFVENIAYKLYQSAKKEGL